MLTSALELSAYKFLMAELKVVKSEESGNFERSAGIGFLEDNSILGNPDCMLFHIKEL